jgi:hypothetical protein
MLATDDSANGNHDHVEEIVFAECAEPWVGEVAEMLGESERGVAVHACS